MNGPGVEEVGDSDFGRTVKKLVMIDCFALFFFIQYVIDFELLLNIFANCLTPGWIWVFVFKNCHSSINFNIA